MSKVDKMKRGLVLVLLFFGVYGCSQSGRQGSYRIMFYNTENLFHPSDDSLTMDDEFTPEGSRHWSFYRYWKKIAAIDKVILAAGEGSPPEVIGLCEIENRQVLDDLVAHPLLLKYGYKIVHRDSPDPRGIDVAFLYRKDFDPLDYKFHKLSFPDSFSETREILHVRGVFKMKDTVDFIVNHWTSRYGGVVSSASKRAFQSETVEQIIDSLQKSRNASLIIAMGDFNDNPSSLSISRLTERQIVRLPEQSYSSDAVEGSYKYQGRWETIDHFLIATTEDMSNFSGSVFSLPHLVEPDDRYTGVKPSRTYIGYSYHGGVSDHLPVLLDIIR